MCKKHIDMKIEQACYVDYVCIRTLWVVKNKINQI